MAKQKLYPSNYYVATHWLHNDMILCNEIADLDSSIWDNARFDFEDEEGNSIDIYQYFLTDCNEGDVEWLEKTFPGLLFTYSDMLNLYVLCVDHLGTGWDYVYQDTTLENAQAAEGDKLGL